MKADKHLKEVFIRTLIFFLAIVMCSLIIKNTTDWYNEWNNVTLQEFKEVSRNLCMHWSFEFKQSSFCAKVYSTKFTLNTNSAFEWILQDYFNCWVDGDVIKIKRTEFNY